jgi:hypothetical protein
MSSSVDGINSATNIANSLSSLGFLDRNKSSRNDVEQLGDNIQKVSTAVGCVIPGSGPFVAALGAVIGCLGGLSG